MFFDRYENEDYSRFDSDPPREEIVKNYRLGKIGPIVLKAVDYWRGVTAIPEKPAPWRILNDNGETCMKKLGNKTWSIRFDTCFYVTIMDDPLLQFPNQFLVQDKWKAVGVLVVDHLDMAEAEDPTKFKFGTVLMIRNPTVMPISGGGFIGRFYYSSALKLEVSMHSAAVVGTMKDMCRYCLKENAKMRCKECSRRYCDRKCQIADWKTQSHKAICKAV